MAALNLRESAETPDLATVAMCSHGRLEMCHSKRRRDEHKARAAASSHFI